MSRFRFAAIAFLLIAVSQFVDPLNVWATESDEIRERAALMQQEAAELVQDGQEEKAAVLRRKARALLQQSERLQRERPDRRRSEIMEVRKLLDKLRSKERELAESDRSSERLAKVRAEAERVEQELGEFEGERRGPRDRQPSEVARRLEHMRMAVEHLEQAGLHEEAEHVARRAEETERRLHRHHRGDADQIGEIARHVEEMRREIRLLRDQVTELIEQRITVDRQPSRPRDRGEVERDRPRRRLQQRDTGLEESPETRRERGRQEKEN
jgi:hypothetical protein